MDVCSWRQQTIGQIISAIRMRSRKSTSRPRSSLRDSCATPYAKPIQNLENEIGVFESQIFDATYADDYCFSAWSPADCTRPLFSTIFVRDSGGRITNRNTTYGFPNERSRFGDDWEQASFVYTNEGWLDAFVSTVQLTKTSEFYDDDHYYGRNNRFGSVTGITDVTNTDIFEAERLIDGRAVEFRFNGGSSAINWPVEYDSEGRVKQLGPHSFEYDQWSSLTTVHDPTGDYAESYIYDFQGRLVGVIDGGGEIDIFLYDGGDPVERWSAGPREGDPHDPQDIYVWRPGSQQMLAAMTEESDGEVIFPVTDERQSIVGVWNDRQLVMEEYMQYDPDGRVRIRVKDRHN
jgi:hypothetical protein